jgi:hypothetical protein
VARQNEVVASRLDHNAVVPGGRRIELRHELSGGLRISDQQARPGLGGVFGHDRKRGARHLLEVLLQLLRGCPLDGGRSGGNDDLRGRPPVTGQPDLIGARPAGGGSRKQRRKPPPHEPRSKPFTPPPSRTAV